MPKAEIEFTHVTTLTAAPLTPSDPPKSGHATIRILSHDARTGDQTSVLYHPPGSSWGAPICMHEYWEEAYILEGRIYDETLQKWFEKGSFCCRPPWMKHGPYKADSEAGCEEICYWRYPRKAEKGSKILPTTMRKSSGISVVSPRSQLEQVALDTPATAEEPQEIVHSTELGEGNATSPVSLHRPSRLAAYLAGGEKRPKAVGNGENLAESPRKNAQAAENPEAVSRQGPSIVNAQSRLAAYLANGVKRPKALESGAKPVESPRQSSQTTEHPDGVNTQGPSSSSAQSRLAAYLASEEKRSVAQATYSAPVEEARENAKPKGDQSRTPPTPKRQSRLATYLASEENRPKVEGNGAKAVSQPTTPPSPSSIATPPRQSRLAAYRSGGWNS